jgi:hypothetical protein
MAMMRVMGEVIDGTVSVSSAVCRKPFSIARNSHLQPKKSNAFVTGPNRYSSPVTISNMSSPTSAQKDAQQLHWIREYLQQFTLL